MLEHVLLATTIFVVLTTLVILVRWRLPPAPNESRTAKELVSAWWDEHRFVVGLISAGLFGLALYSTLDAFALALGLTAWTLNEHRRMLQPAGHGSHVANVAMYASGVGFALMFGVMATSIADGARPTFWFLVIATLVLGINLTRHPGSYAKDAVRASVSLAVIVMQAFLHYGGAAPNVDDAVHALEDPLFETAHVIEHLTAAGVPFDRDVAEASLRSAPFALNGLASLGWETRSDVAQWREGRHLARDSRNLRMLARHGSPQLDSAAIIALAMEHVDDTEDDDWFAHAATAADVLTILDTPDALVLFQRLVHPGIVARAVERPLIDATFFMSTPAEAEAARADGTAPSTGHMREPLLDATALMRVVGVPEGLDTASIARGAAHISFDGKRSYLPAVATHAELIAWPDAEPSLPRAIINHRATLAALLVALVTLIAGFTAPKSTESAAH